MNECFRKVEDVIDTYFVREAEENSIKISTHIVPQ